MCPTESSLPETTAHKCADHDSPHLPLVPKLKSLTLSHLDVLYGLNLELLTVLKGRRDQNIGLKNLIVRSCRTHEGDKEKLREVVKKVKWVNVVEKSADAEETEEDSDSDELGSLDDY